MSYTRTMILKRSYIETHIYAQKQKKTKNKKTKMGRVKTVFCTRHGESFYFLLQKISKKELVQKWGKLRVFKDTDCTIGAGVRKTGAAAFQR